MSPYPRPPSFLFLKPGELVVSEEPLVVSTLLGSCVAVIMFSRRRKLGGICHALLPRCRKGEPCRHRPEEAGKYLECAVRRMLETMMSLGASREEIEVKLFGGADMFDSVGGRNGTVGRQNIETALGLLQAESLRLVGKDLGGRRGRKIIFHSDTGEVFLKRLRATESPWPRR